MNAEGLGNGGAGDIGVQNADLVAPAAHGDGQLAGDHGLAHAALAGHDAVDLADSGGRIVFLQQGLGLLPLAAALTAGGAIVRAFAHKLISFCFCIDKYSIDRSAKSILYPSDRIRQPLNGNFLVSGEKRGFPAVAGEEKDLPVLSLTLQPAEGRGAAVVIEV